MSRATTSPRASTSSGSGATAATRRRWAAGPRRSTTSLNTTASYLVYKHVFHVSESTATRGFSGIVAALFGLLYAATVGYVWELVDWRRAADTALLVLLLTMVGILFRGGQLDLTVAAVAAVGVVLAGVRIVPVAEWHEPRQLVDAVGYEPNGDEGAERDGD